VFYTKTNCRLKSVKQFLEVQAVAVPAWGFQFSGFQVSSFEVLAVAVPPFFRFSGFEVLAVAVPPFFRFSGL
jgi:hypothetical protein